MDHACEVNGDAGPGLVQGKFAGLYTVGEAYYALDVLIVVGGIIFRAVHVRPQCFVHRLKNLLRD